jgi:hypothetical protein
LDGAQTPGGPQASAVQQAQSGAGIVTDRTIDLDEHRGMAAQKATELRRLLVGVQADQAALKARQDALEEMLAALPAAGWPEAVEKARYLLTLFAETPAAEDPRRQRLIADVLADFERLLGDLTHPHSIEPLAANAPDRGLTEDPPLAKVQKRSNREQKKPKQDKPKAAAPVLPLAPSGEGSDPPRPAGSKK